jgi:hypothetical protein
MSKFLDTHAPEKKNCQPRIPQQRCLWKAWQNLTSFFFFFIFSLNFSEKVEIHMKHWDSITASATPMPAVLDTSHDFLIAYAAPDRRQAQNLYWFLQDHDCKVFLDVEDIRLGMVWPLALREALEKSHAIVVLVSTHTDDAFYQQEEIVRAIQLTRDQPRAHTVIPVILEKLSQGAVSMPYGLSSRQALDATRPGGLKRVAAELVAWLRDNPLDAK